MKSLNIELRKDWFTNYETALMQALDFQRDMTLKGFMTSSTCSKEPSICQVTVHHAAGTMPLIKANYQPTSLYIHEWYDMDSRKVCAATSYRFEVEE